MILHISEYSDSPLALFGQLLLRCLPGHILTIMCIYSWDSLLSNIHEITAMFWNLGVFRHPWGGDNGYFRGAVHRAAKVF